METTVSGVKRFGHGLGKMGCGLKWITGCDAGRTGCGMERLGCGLWETGCDTRRKGCELSKVECGRHSWGCGQQKKGCGTERMGCGLGRTWCGSGRTVLVSLLLLALPLHTTSIKPKEYLTNVRVDADGSPKVISSRGFFGRGLYTHAFTHVWTVTAPQGMDIQIVFTDYHIRNNSYIKISDGSNAFIFTSNELPIFQETRRVGILLKSSHRRKTEFYRGVRAQVRAVSYKRERWSSKSMPSTGYCGDIKWSLSSFVFQPPSHVIHSYMFHCVWYIKAAYLKVTHIQLRGSNMSDEDSPAFSVHRGGYSASPSDFTFTWPGPSKSTLLHSANMTFYIRLHSRMVFGDRVEVQFSNISGDVGLLQTVNTLPRDPCPFKTNINYIPRCYLYWVNPNSLESETCFKIPRAVTCKGGRYRLRRCFGPLDICDRYPDCPHANDEPRSCGGEADIHWFAANVLAALMLILVGWGCGCRRRGYQRSVRDYRRSCCSQECLNTYGCTQACLSTVATQCMQCCERVCPSRTASTETANGRVSNSTVPGQYVSPRMPVVCISAGVDARMHHSHLVHAAAVLNRSPGRSDVTTRWDAQPPGVSAGVTFPLHALPVPAVSTAVGATTTSNSLTVPGVCSGLPTYEQVRMADLGVYTGCSSAEGSQVNLLTGQGGQSEVNTTDPPPSYSDAITSPQEDSAPPTYACVLRMSYSEI